MFQKWTRKSDSIRNRNKDLALKYQGTHDRLKQVSVSANRKFIELTGVV